MCWFPLSCLSTLFENRVSLWLLMQTSWVGSFWEYSSSASHLPHGEDSIDACAAACSLHGF